nr:hypothetical protein Iba_chr10aCG7780 [Ipomoea batatas]GMD45152.1 hypothetical protein Iba_chr10dCG7270 [Ipomoea batatas]
MPAERRGFGKHGTECAASQLRYPGFCRMGGQMFADEDQTSKEVHFADSACSGIAIGVHGLAAENCEIASAWTVVSGFGVGGN